MTYRQFVVPRDIFYGPGALDALRTLPGKRVLVVTDPVVRRLGIVERVETILRGGDVEITVFDKTDTEPTKRTIETIFSIAQDFRPDTFIGLGGGSAIDAGKGAWVLYEHPDLAALSLPDIARELPRRVLRGKAKYAAIATTSGTGSEVTCMAVINSPDVVSLLRVVMRSPQLVPDVAIADPELVRSMPPELTANTGFDALVHAIECYVLTPPSDIVDSLAVGAARVVMEWLPVAVADGENMKAREKMHMAALQAGMAFSNGRIGLVHVAADQIDFAFRLPHGRACALMLCPSFAFLYPGYRERLVNLAVLLGISGADDRTRVNNLLRNLDGLKQKVGIPLAIKEIGEEKVFQAQLEPMVEGYMNRVRAVWIKMTPDARRAAGMPGTVDELKELFTHAWNGTWAELT